MLLQRQVENRENESDIEGKAHVSSGLQEQESVHQMWHVAFHSNVVHNMQ